LLFNTGVFNMPTAHHFDMQWAAWPSTISGI